MSAFVSWTSKHPPEKVYLVQWDHIEALHGKRRDVRRMHVWCDAESLKGEIEHLERREMEYSVTEYSKNTIPIPASDSEQVNAAS